MPWQPLGIEFPDIELVLTGALRALLPTDVHVDRAVPATRKPRMVIVTRDGGRNNGESDTPRVRMRFWDVTPKAATDLARQVCALMPTLVGSNGIVRVENQSGPVEIPDASGDNQRYALFEIRVQGVTP